MRNRAYRHRNKGIRSDRITFTRFQEVSIITTYLNAVDVSRDIVQETAKPAGPIETEQGSTQGTRRKRAKTRAVHAGELSSCIADPDTVCGTEAQPSRNNVSEIETKRGLQINLKTLQRARRIFDRLLFA